MPTPRRTHPYLTPAQRRREIIQILASAMASMPTAYAVPGKPPAVKLSKKPPTCLDVSGD
jgi:hypothetical protein